MAMATPAIFLFVVTCLVVLLHGSRGDDTSDTTSSELRGETIDNAINNGIVHSIMDGTEDFLERNHGHHYNGYHPRSNSEKDHDSSFDFYVYSMSYQPEFCRENKEKFVGCHHYSTNWEGQLTIHGLWPNVRCVFYVFVFFCLWYQYLRVLTAIHLVVHVKLLSVLSWCYSSFTLLTTEK